MAISSIAQKSLKDSCYRFPIIGAHFGAQYSAGDLKKRFGFNMEAGAPVLYKTKKNWLFGLDGAYFFGNRVREDVLAGMRTEEGFIINSEGNPGQARLNERGWHVYLVFGKVFSKWGHNKNSGPVAYAGAGYMQHKIHIYDVGRNLPQVYGDLKKGYDRLSAGPAINGFLGYLYFSENRLINFLIGFDVYAGFTKGLRGYQYDLMRSDSDSRTDILYGLRFSWLFPLYKRTPKEFYYY